MPYTNEPPSLENEHNTQRATTSAQLTTNEPSHLLNLPTHLPNEPPHLFIHEGTRSFLTTGHSDHALTRGDWRFAPLGFYWIPTYCLISVYRPVRAVDQFNHWLNSTLHRHLISPISHHVASTEPTHLKIWDSNTLFSQMFFLFVVLCPAYSLLGHFLPFLYCIPLISRSTRTSMFLLPCTVCVYFYIFLVQGEQEEFLVRQPLNSYK